MHLSREIRVHIDQIALDLMSADDEDETPVGVNGLTSEISQAILDELNEAVLIHSPEVRKLTIRGVEYDHDYIAGLIEDIISGSGETVSIDVVLDNIRFLNDTEYLDDINREQAELEAANNFDDC